MTELDIDFNHRVFGICKNCSCGNIPLGVLGLVSRGAERRVIWYQTRGNCETALLLMSLLVLWLALMQGSPLLGMELFLKLALAGACRVLLTSHPQNIWPFLYVNQRCFCRGCVGAVSEKWALRSTSKQSGIGESEERAEKGDLGNSESFAKRGKNPDNSSFGFPVGYCRGRTGEKPVGEAGPSDV